MLIDGNKVEEGVDQPSSVKDDPVKNPIVANTAGTRKSPRFQDKSTPTPEPLALRPNDTVALAGLLNIKKEVDGKKCINVVNNLLIMMFLFYGRGNYIHDTRILRR